ncbi:transposase [Microbacterium sp. NPDC090225]|uniref:transposase n=1 Tax=Microbacterium sp. NPDC090225 TaxID=3364207 RepID=UPI0037FC5F19
MTAGDELTRIATELYVRPLGEFVSARRERAKQAADRGLASAITALRKPSIAAWVVNVFAQERTAELGEALQLARELREAQDDLDAPALARLGRERRTLTRRLAEKARDLAVARGEKVTSGTLDAVQQTIGAAFFDEAASIAVASGRLIREIEPSESVILDQILGGGATEARDAVPAQQVDELAQRRRRRQAEQAVREAESAVTSAERARTTAESAGREAGRRIEDATTRAADLERRLARTRMEVDAARADAESAEARATTAAAALEVATEELAAARRALQHLT